MGKKINKKKILSKKTAKKSVGKKSKLPVAKKIVKKKKINKALNDKKKAIKKKNLSTKKPIVKSKTKEKVKEKIVLEKKSIIKKNAKKDSNKTFINTTDSEIYTYNKEEKTRKKKNSFLPLSGLKFDSIGDEYIYLFEIIYSSKLSEFISEKPTVEELRKIYQEYLVDGGKAELIKKYENSSIYWSDIQEKAMIDFIKEEDYVKKDRIFKKYLHKSLIKLIENIIFNFKLFRSDVEIDELQDDCLSFIITKIDKFDIHNGAKAFSYFGTIAKHYLMGEKRISYKMTKTNLDIDENIDEASEKPENIYEINIEDDHYKNVNNLIFEETIKKLESEMLKPKMLLNDKKVAEAIVFIFKNHDQIGTYNKNLVYHLLKERTGLQTKEITYSLGRLKNIYKNFKLDLLKSKK